MTRLSKLRVCCCHFLLFLRIFFCYQITVSFDDKALRVIYLNWMVLVKNCDSQWVPFLFNGMSFTFYQHVKAHIFWKVYQYHICQINFNYVMPLMNQCSWRSVICFVFVGKWWLELWKQFSRKRTRGPQSTKRTIGKYVSKPCVCLEGHEIKRKQNNIGGTLVRWQITTAMFIGGCKVKRAL